MRVVVVFFVCLVELSLVVVLIISFVKYRLEVWAGRGVFFVIDFVIKFCVRILS